jgi:hypothetical protein
VESLKLPLPTVDNLQPLSQPTSTVTHMDQTQPDQVAL